MVTEFLTLEVSSLIKIHRHLESMYGEDAIDVSSVRCWVCHSKSGEKDTGDRPRSGRPALAAMMETKQKVDALIQDDCHITNELCTTIGIGKGVVMAIFKELGYRTTCATWVLKMHPVDYKTA
jgi:hypothetical protein